MFKSTKLGGAVKTLKNITLPLGKLDKPVTAKKLLLAALESYQPGMVGLKNIINTIRLYEKIELTEGDLQLEDAEFDVIVTAIDTTQWAPSALQAREFFVEIERLR